MSTWSLDTSASPTCPPPVTTLSTPAGIPASAKAPASSIAVDGASSDGFRTTVLPASNAGQTFHIARMSGPFHGVIAPTTPNGS
jgi:hypothetical protein